MRGKVTGIEVQVFKDADMQFEGLTELIIAPDTPARKARMIELGDAFIAFPVSGTGTLEEVAEVMSLVSLKWVSAPCILNNLNG